MNISSQNILFSLVMPAYNAAETIIESINSVLSQTYGNWELVIVDDGSIDQTLDVIKNFAKKDSRIKFVSQENAGTAAANNAGIAIASGDYITILPSDDWLLPEYLFVMNKIINSNPLYDIYFVNGYAKYQNGDEVLIVGEQDFAQDVDIFSLIKRCPCSLGAMVRRGVHYKLGGYRSERYTEDYDLWMRAKVDGFNLGFFNACLVKVRLSDTQKSANVSEMYKSDISIMKDLINSSKDKKITFACESRINSLKKEMFLIPVKSRFFKLRRLIAQLRK